MLLPTLRDCPRLIALRCLLTMLTALPLASTPDAATAYDYTLEWSGTTVTNYSPVEIWESASSDVQSLFGDFGDALPGITTDFATDKSFTIHVRAPAGKRISIAPPSYPVSFIDTSFKVDLRSAENSLVGPFIEGSFNGATFTGLEGTAPSITSSGISFASAGGGPGQAFSVTTGFNAAAPFSFTELTLSYTAPAAMNLAYTNGGMYGTVGATQLVRQHRQAYDLTVTATTTANYMYNPLAPEIGLSEDQQTLYRLYTSGTSLPTANLRLGGTESWTTIWLQAPAGERLSFAPPSNPAVDATTSLLLDLCTGTSLHGAAYGGSVGPLTFLGLEGVSPVLQSSFVSASPAEAGGVPPYLGVSLGFALTGSCSFNAVGIPVLTADELPVSEIVNSVMSCRFEAIQNGVVYDGVARDPGVWVTRLSDATWAGNAAFPVLGDPGVWVTAEPVPEPAATGLVAIAVAAAFVVRGRRPRRTR